MLFVLLSRDVPLEFNGHPFPIPFRFREGGNEDATIKDCSNNWYSEEYMTNGTLNNLNFVEGNRRSNKWSIYQS